jgi:tRNA pseudouridine55 synthase
VAELRRLWAEPFRDMPMHAPAQLEALAAQGEAQLLASLLPLEAGLAHLPRVDLDAGQAFRLGQGQRLPWAGPGAEAGEWAAFGPDGRALGLVRLQPDGLLKPERLFRHAVEAALGPPRSR